jgi:DNA modification methylase
VWAKNVFGMGKGYRHQHEFCLFNGTIDEGINNESDLWEIAKDTNYVHPTQKPVGLCARALKNHKKAEVIVDLFGGSGSTMMACEQLNRKCYMCELDPHYIDVIIQRYINFKGSDEDVYLIREGKRIPYKEVI